MAQRTPSDPQRLQKPGQKVDVVKKVVVKTHVEGLNVCEVAGQCVTVRRTFETAQRKLRPEDTSDKDQSEAGFEQIEDGEAKADLVSEVASCTEEDAVRTQGEAWTSRASAFRMCRVKVQRSLPTDIEELGNYYELMAVQ